MHWIITPVSEWPVCAENWQMLNRSAANTPLLDFLFVRDAIEEFATGGESIATCYQGDAPVAMAVLTRTNRFCWQTLQPPNAPIGFWVGRPSANIEELLRGLPAALSPQSGMVSITQQDPNIVPRPLSTQHLSTLAYIVTASLSMPSSFQSYVEGRSKNFRHNISRQKNRLKRDNIVTRIEFLTAAAAMAQAVGDYSNLEGASWKGRINSAVRIDEPQGRFYIRLMQSFAERGEALVYRYFFGDRLVASDLCICRNGILIILKTACDETVQGLSPAHLMRLEAFAELVDRRGVRRVEFYGPVKDWHMRLTEDTREMYHINYYRWPLVRAFHEFRIARRRNAINAVEPAEVAQEQPSPRVMDAN